MPAGDDRDVEPGSAPDPGQSADRLHRLPSLLDRVADQAHARNLSSDEQPPDVGLKVGPAHRDLDRPILGA
jgi:hypothetical protein